jgi:succinyl-CoA synthetase beta subunit
MVLFTHEGGVEVGDVDAKALTLLIPVGGELPDRETIKKDLLSGVEGEERKEALVDFLARLYSVYVELHFAYLEINPLVAVEVNGKTEIFYLDMAAKLDQVRLSFFQTYHRIRPDDIRYDRRLNLSLDQNGPSLEILRPLIHREFKLHLVKC